MTVCPTNAGKKRKMPNAEVDSNHPPSIPAEAFDMHKAFTADVWQVWGKHRDRHSPDFHKFYRVSVASLTGMAAATAVDVGMTEERFLATCKANYAEAVKRAPRFG
jgi:hypothetical protein